VEVEPPVDTCTTTFPVTPELNVSAAGLNVHTAFAGSELHAKLNAPEDPASGVNTSVYSAPCPLATDCVLDPRNATVKSNPIPFSATVAAAGSALLLTVRFPVCAPAAVGANSTLAVQLNPGPRLAAQVSFTRRNPAGAVSVRSVSASARPVLVTVTVVALLVCPAPVTGKLIVAGVTCTAAASAPAPLSVTLAWLPIAGEATFNVPVAAPVAAGANTTPTEHDAPPPRLVPQVFAVSANPALAVSASCVAASLLVLLMVTVCAALELPTAVAVKLNCAGFTFSPAAAFPTPFNATVNGVFTPLAAMVNEAEFSPAA
jgi:hypothetical protein